jgi:hypothetical protein
MKRELFRCDYCEISKFDSETQEYVDLPFSCGTKHEWLQHISRPKHCLNVARNENLEDDLVIKCKHCDGIFTKKQYQKHKNRNIVLWWSTDPMYKDCSCNNFIYNGKRFETMELLKVYAECRYDNGRKKYKYTPKPKKIKSFNERGQELKKQLEEKEKKVEKVVQPLVEKVIDNVTMSIEEEYDLLNGIEQKESPKTDLNEPPIWDSEDICNECGKPDNFYRQYSDYKLEKYEVSLCDCDDSEDSDYD